MVRVLTTLSVAGVTALFWAVVPLARLFDAFQPMVVALSIIIAAVFVRLNRGMPTLEWKSLEPNNRKKLTKKIVDLSKEYVLIVAINGVALLSIVTLIVVGKDALVGNKDLPAILSEQAQKVIAAGVGALFSLCFAKMAYVVWRDCDIMELQKYLIDHIAEHEEAEHQKDISEVKLSEMKASMLRNQPVSPSKDL